ncbi:MAG: Trk system potassium transporter TrkA [Moheibacter sp.]
MKIVIGGAGEVGFHLAKWLSKEMLDVVVIDTDKEKLHNIESNLDVMVHRGDITSFDSLRAIKVEEADIFITVTQLQNTNLTSALIAKKMGAKRTIARITNPEFLRRENAVAVQRIGIDVLISPEQLAALEIHQLVEESAFNTMHAFANGELKLFGTVLDKDCKVLGKQVREVIDVSRQIPHFMPIAIIRNIERGGGHETIIPRGDTVYQLNDQVYFIALKHATAEIYNLLGKKQEFYKNVIVLGGGSIGKKTVSLLKESKHNVKLIEKDRNKAFDLADELNNILIIHGDGRDGDLLEEEGIGNSDAFIAVTGSSEANIMSCLVARSKGVKKTIALVENMDYIHLSQEVGISAFINKKLLAADSIFRYIRKGDVVDVTGLSDVDAEVLEFKVDESSPIVNKTLKEIKLPKESIVGGIVRKNEGFIPTGDFRIMSGDRVVVFVQPSAISKIGKYFQ